MAYETTTPRARQRARNIQAKKNAAFTKTGIFGRDTKTAVRGKKRVAVVHTGPASPGKQSATVLGRGRKAGYGATRTKSAKVRGLQRATTGQRVRTGKAFQKALRRETGVGKRQATNTGRAGNRRKGFEATRGKTKTGARRLARRTPRAPKVVGAVRRAASGRRWNAAAHPRASNGRFRKK